MLWFWGRSVLPQRCVEIGSQVQSRISLAQSKSGQRSRLRTLAGVKVLLLDVGRRLFRIRREGRIGLRAVQQVHRVIQLNVVLRFRGDVSC